MKKILSIAAVALVALGFASCNQNPPVKVDSFKINVTNVEARSATVTVTPLDTNATYYWDILPAAEAAKLSDDSIGIYFKAYFDEVIAYYKQQYDYDLTYADLVIKGEESYDFTKLDPNTPYTVVAIAIDTNAVASGAATRKNFQTKEVQEDPVPADMTFQFAVDSITFNSAYVAVTPSTNEATYYWNIFKTAEIANMTDDALCKAIKSNIEETIEMYAMFGYDLTFADFLDKGPSAYTFSELSANTAYTAIAVAMGTEGTTNGVVGKKNFQTLEVVASDSVELAFHAAIIDDYRDVDGSFQIVAYNEDSTFAVFLNPYSETLAGTFTEKDLDAEYSGVIDYVEKESYGIASAEFTGVETEAGADYAGWFLAENSVKYFFSFNATLVEDEPAAAPAKARAAKKAPAVKKDAKNFKKGNLQVNKGSKFVSEKLFNR